MGDIVSLVEKASQDLDQENVKKSRRKFDKKVQFSMEDYSKSQLKTNEKNGWYGRGIVYAMPGVSKDKKTNG